jgi:hypothetical protein
MKDHGAEMSNFVGAIESDLGAGHPIGILFGGKPQIAEWLQPIANVLHAIGAETINGPGGTGEDISAMTDKGVPSFAPNQDSRFYFNYHHTPADTFDKVNPRELAENAAVMAVLSYALADSEKPAPR